MTSKVTVDAGFSPGCNFFTGRIHPQETDITSTPNGSNTKRILWQNFRHKQQSLLKRWWWRSQAQDKEKKGEDEVKRREGKEKETKSNEWNEERSLYFRGRFLNSFDVTAESIWHPLTSVCFFSLLLVFPGFGLIWPDFYYFLSVFSHV